MKLYLSETSPYARIVRIAVAEKRIEHDVELIFHATRVPDSPVNAVNPTARVPTLELPSGVVLSESRLICEHLDQVAPQSRFVSPVADTVARAREGLATGFLDGVAVWSRELGHRVETERSATVLAHERARSERCLAHFDARTEELSGDPKFLHATVFIALTSLSSRCGLEWSERYRALGAWYDAFERLDSIARSAAPPLLAATRAASAPRVN